VREESKERNISFNMYIGRPGFEDNPRRQYLRMLEYDLKLVLGGGFKGYRVP
jgi:hypothetical protein